MNVDNISGIGPKNQKILEKIGIVTVDDILSYYPYRYDFIKIGSLEDHNEVKVIQGQIIDNPKVMYIKKNLNKMSFRLLVDNKVITVVIFNRAFLKLNLNNLKQIIVVGKYDNNKNIFTASDIKFNCSNNSIEPIYHLTEGLKRTFLIKIIATALDMNYSVIDKIPNYLNEKYNFISKDLALKYIHRPKNIEEIKLAKLKLIYEELFDFMFKINYLKKFNKKVIGIKRDNINIESFINALPFKLTSDQLKALNDIQKDLTSEFRMNRLLLGDVGSGKTIVSFLAMYINYLSGYQSAMMAPTEILASQHYNNCVNLFKNTDINVGILTGKMTKKEKEKIYIKIENHEIDIIIGTHSLFNESINYDKLGLVITDEQHRFGVNDRNSLQKKGINPDVLYLSATPIPRTYALTIYGDLDISMIENKPIGRKDVKTIIKKESEIKDVLYKMLEELKQGHQIYVVSPLIENNDELDLKSVVILKEKFSMAFPNIRIEILHGKLKNEEKSKIMADFENGKIKILISTTVIEVGIDVKNSSMMIIYNAERFGLATLHQLRGRVGRGNEKAYCYLISNYDLERLKILEESNDGFYISEKDFELRGGGDIFGIKQSGEIGFKIADLKRDYKILLQAKKDSEEFIETKEYKNIDYYQEIINEITFIN